MKAEQLAFDLPARLTPDVADSLYAAGFFDGEGCVSVGKVGKKTPIYRSQVNVQQTVLLPLEWLRDRWGGKIYNSHPPGKRNRVQSWQWVLPEGRQAAFLEDVLPYLKVKRPVVENALSLLRLKAKRPRGEKLTETSRAEHEAHVQTHRGFGLAHSHQRGDWTT